MKKTKTQQLYEKLKPGTKVYVILNTWQVKKKCIDIERTNVPILLKAKVIKNRGNKAYNVDYCHDKNIRIKLDVTKTTDEATLIVDAINNVFLDRDKAIKRYKRLVSRYQTYINKQQKVIDKVKENCFVLNEK